MKIIRDLEERGKTLVLDDTSFINCRFTECTLLFHGGDSACTDCKFDNCPIVLQGAAARTQNFLQGLGWKPPDHALKMSTPPAKPVLH